MSGKPVKFPTATRQDHEKFCVTEGWTERKRATGRRGTHHVNYEFALPDGRILLTRISHPPDRSTYGCSLWAHILRDQLDVTNTEFWNCVDHSIVPIRGITQITRETIPLSIIKTLVNEAGLSESEIKAMTKAQAVTRLSKYYTTGK